MSSLAPGRTLAHYRIEGRLGAGGMGEVYKATDTKLNRLVAVKVLPATAASDTTAHARLLEEARSAAALTHPHIVTIYSVDSAEGIDFIVMEHVDGKSLKERLAEGLLDVPEIFRIGIEVADALAAAHAIGIVHRDIKPANILLTSMGSAKVLDFGIAKRMVSDSTETIGGTATNLTVAGMVVGSAAYMAPEQARGEPIDGRADIFSLGATLYEAATGRQAFEGSSALDTMIAVATKNPPLASLVRPDLPVDLDVVLARALAKKRDERFETPRELADALRGLREGTESFTSTGSALRAVLPTVPNNIPTPLTSFIGRSRERGEVRRLLGTSRLVTILGPGGSGKTRLAVQVAKELMADFREGAWLAEFETLADPALVPQQVAHAMGIAEEPGTPIAGSVAKAIGKGSVLLVLDNCEHLAAAFAPFLSKLLASAPGLRIIATSREALGVAGEMNWRIPTLSVPDPRTSTIKNRETASRYEAVKLFVDRAQSAHPAFQLVDKNAETVAAICHRLDGIPLAIELAAVRVKVLPVEQILARLQDRFALLTGGSRSADPRQQTLRATVDWSYELLSVQERKLLNRVSVFAGGFTLESAEAICAWNGLETFDVLDLLGPLIDKSLVVPSESAETPRYTLLETIRDYAAERLRQVGEESPQATRHALHFFKMALQAEPELQGPGQASWFQLLDRDADNLRLAIHAYAVQNDAGAALLMVGAIWRWWWTRGRWEEGRVILREVLANPAAAGPTPERARALYASAVLARGQGDTTAAASYLAESLQIAESLDDKAGIGNALFEQGNLANARVDFAAATELYERSLAIRREINDRRGVSLVLHNLAVLAQARSDGAPTARRLFEEALELHRELGNAAMEAHTLNGLTDVVLHAGDLDSAQLYLERGLAIQRELGNRDGTAFSLRQLGEVATRRGDVAGARALLAEGFEIFRTIGNSSGLVDLLDSAAKLAAGLGEAERSLLLASAGATWRAAIDVPRGAPDETSLGEALTPARQALGDRAPDVETRGTRLTPQEAIQLLEKTLQG